MDIRVQYPTNFNTQGTVLKCIDVNRFDASVHFHCFIYRFLFLFVLIWGTLLSINIIQNSHVYNLHHQNYTKYTHNNKLCFTSNNPNTLKITNWNNCVLFPIQFPQIFSGYTSNLNKILYPLSNLSISNLHLTDDYFFCYVLWHNSYKEWTEHSLEWNW